jgi:hypothetical protein
MTNTLHPTTDTQPKYRFIGILKDYTTFNDTVALAELFKTRLEYENV